MKKPTVIALMAMLGMAVGAQAQGFMQEATLVSPDGLYVTAPPFTVSITYDNQPLQLIDPKVNDWDEEYVTAFVKLGDGDALPVSAAVLYSLGNPSDPDDPDVWNLDIALYELDDLFDFTGNEVTVMIPEGIVKNNTGDVNRAQDFVFEILPAYTDYTLTPEAGSTLSRDLKVSVGFGGNQIEYNQSAVTLYIYQPEYKTLTLKYGKEVTINDAGEIVIDLSSIPSGEYEMVVPEGFVTVIADGEKYLSPNIWVEYTIDNDGGSGGGIIEKPSGQVVNYSKRSAGTFVLGDRMGLYKDEFPAEIVWGEKGKVYFKNLVSVFPMDFYLEATVSGNTITMPTGQMVEYYPEESYGVIFGVLRTVEDDDEVLFEVAPEIKSITFTVSDDGSIRMNLPGEPFDYDTDEEYIPSYVAGFYYSDDNQFLGYSDFYQEYTKLDLQMVTIPEGADVKQYVYIDSYNYASIVDVATVGDDLYIRGLSAMLPEGTIRAKISGDKAVVAQDEYLGVYFDQYYIFTKVLYANPDYDEEDPESSPFYFAPSDVGFELNIDPTTGTIYADKEGVYLSFHCDEEDFLNSLGFFEVFELKYQESFAGTPANPVDLEYHTEWAYQGFNDFFFTISNFSTQGTLLDVEKLYYKVYVNGNPVVFQEKEIENLTGTPVVAYEGVPVEVELLPYLFNNNNDIFKWSENAFDVGIYTDDVETIGVQSVYYYDDVFTYSDIVTLNVETGEITTNGVSSPASDGEVVATEYYTLDGRRLRHPEKGICIRVDRMADGSARASKVVARQ